MHGRTPGGEGYWRPFTKRQLATIDEHNRQVAIMKSKKIHVVCHEHGTTRKRDGSIIAFNPDEGCPRSMTLPNDGFECKASWETIECPSGNNCHCWS
jgi:hypothetical protein